jgi:hypothetical protein
MWSDRSAGRTLRWRSKQKCPEALLKIPYAIARIRPLSGIGGKGHLKNDSNLGNLFASNISAGAMALETREGKYR